MRRFSVFLLVLMLLGACARSLSPEEQAAQAAKYYYDQLLAGHDDVFLRGHAGKDSISGEYREQLLIAYRQFVAQQQASHGGISSVQIGRSAMMDAGFDSTQQYVQVFLNLNYADSTQEEIVVAMVERAGEWKMK
jgi:hypothetical protein